MGELDFYSEALLRSTEMLLQTNPNLANAHDALVSSADHVAKLLTERRREFAQTLPSTNLEEILQMKH